VTTITNTGDIALPLAVWLLDDNYDYIKEDNYISVTGLMKPLRQIVLPSRIPPEEQSLDVSDLIASSLGHAIHDSIEKSWSDGRHVRALRMLGYPQQIVDQIRVNPSDEEYAAGNGIIPVFLERRGIRPFGEHKIGGKFDLVADGIIQDNKSTSVFAWVKGTRDDEHILQMSLYRWIDAYRTQQGLKPRITEDYGVINYIFTDWSKMMANSVGNYPPKRVMTKHLQLMSLDETEAWVVAKLALIQRWKDAPEAELPHCTDIELWRSEPVYKYFADPLKVTGRSTKNFDNLAEANRFCAEKGKGVVITKPGEPKRCSYCAAFDICTQKDAYL
jgi:hypothetical protein